MGRIDYSYVAPVKVSGNGLVDVMVRVGDDGYPVPDIAKTYKTFLSDALPLNI